LASREKIYAGGKDCASSRIWKGRIKLKPRISRMGRLSNNRQLKSETKLEAPKRMTFRKRIKNTN